MPAISRRTLGILASLAATAGATPAARPALAQSVPTYHNNFQRQGAFTVAGLTKAAAATVVADTAFAGSISGGQYAQPLYYQRGGTAPDLIIAVTETNQVYALNATTGAVVWHQAGLPAADTNADSPCGNVSPEGITGTPVIDVATGTLYLSALIGSGPAHQLFALSLADGSIKTGWPIDVGSGLKALGISFSASTQGQRSGLSLLQGKLYVAYGGKYGDCGSYHGLVVEVAPTTQKITAAWSTTANGGGIWAQAGLASDGKALLAATGNTFNASTWSGGEAVVRLKPGLASPTSTVDYFAPANWSSLDSADLDLGGTGAMPFAVSISSTKAAPRVISFGKDGNAYLLGGNNLGGIGGALQVLPLSNGEIKTAPAYYKIGTTSMVAFTDPGSSKCAGTNVAAVSVAGTGAAPMQQVWCTAYNGNVVAPIVTDTPDHANPIVWLVGAEGDNKLHAYDGATGAALFTSSTTMSGLHHFQTLIVAGGRIYVGADNRVYAFTFTPAT